jgi:hypothetical protein
MESNSERKSGFGLNTVILLLILLTLVGGGVMMVRSIQRVTRPLEEARETIQEQFEQITKPTPTIIPDPVTIVREVRSLSRLETASYTVEKIITAESRQGPFGFLFGDRLILVAHGQVIAGVDLEKMDEGDVSVAGDGTVAVTLPEAEVFITALDNEQTYVFNRDTGVIGMNVDLETEARQAAEAEILKAALEDGILEMAQQNANSYIRHLILTLGFEKVEVVVK